MNYKLFLLLLVLITTSLCYASSTTDYFRTVSTGTWATVSIWESSPDSLNWTPATLSPTSAAKTISIRNGNTVFVGGAISTDQTIVEQGGLLSVSTGITLTLADGTGTDLIVNGTLRNNAGTITISNGANILFGSTGLYQHNFTTSAGAIPIATWAAGSTCEIVGYTTDTADPTNLDQAFSNFTFNCPNLTALFNAAGRLTIINGNLTVVSTGTGQFRLKANGAFTVNIAGNLTILSGTLSTSSGNQLTVLNVGGNFTMAGGTLTENRGSTDTIYFTGGSTHLVSVASSAIISNQISFNISTNAIVEFENESTVLGGASSNGAFTVSAGATLIIKHPQGISTTASTGCIRFNGSKSYSTSANYIYRGTTAQVFGNAMPVTVNNLTIDNPAGVTLAVNQAVTNICLVSPNATLNVLTHLITGGTFTLSNNATLITTNTVGITATGGGATGSIQTTTRNFNTGANYTYAGISAQVSGTGYPDLGTGILTVNTGSGVNFSLSGARTLNTNGNVFLASGIFAAGTMLSMGTGSSITRSEGTITGTPQGSGTYSVIYEGNSKTTGNELGGSGLGNITINLSNAGNTLTLDRSITMDNLEVLTFTQGSITLGIYNVIINGSYSASNLFIYNSSGAISGGNIGSIANVLVTTPTPFAFPLAVNTFNVSPGVGNTLVLPGNLAVTTLLFTNGSLGFNGHLLTLAGKDFGLTGTNSISALSVSLANVAHTYESSTSIAHTWQTSGTFTGTVNVELSYPISLTSSSQMFVYQRNHYIGESGWNYLGSFTATDHVTFKTITINAVTTLNGSVKGDLDWTLAETDQELPVELTSFTAALSQTTFVTVQWTTQSETSEIGFNLYRNNIDDLSTAIKVNANLISATNTSFTHTYFFRDMIVTNDDTYYYWLSDVANSGVETFHGPAMVDLGNNGNVTPPPNIPIVSSVQSVYPNPFTPSATINYGVAAKGIVHLGIYNSKGQLVRTLLSEDKDPNNYRTTWDGKDMNGHNCASGVYVIKLVTGGVKSSIKAILMK